MLDKLSNWIAYILQRVVALIIFLLFVLNLVQVVLRYVMKTGILWANDAIILGLLWMCCLGVPWLWLTRQHIVMDAVDAYLSPKVLKYLQIMNSVLATICSVMLTMSAVAAYRVNTGFIATAAGFDESLRYLPFIVCGVLWFVCAIIDFLKGIQEVRRNEY